MLRYLTVTEPTQTEQWVSMLCLVMVRGVGLMVNRDIVFYILVVFLY
jgi:hypothetical protein